MVSHVRCLAAASAYDITGQVSSDDVVYICLPLYHSAALTMAFGNVITKG